MSAPVSAAASSTLRLLLLLRLVLHGSATEMPSFSLVQESPSSPVTCHATGFYPEEARLFWTKNGTQLSEGVVLHETVPNHDGTFQKSADLDVSSVPPEDWDRYTCVFTFTETNEVISIQLDRTEIRDSPSQPAPFFPLGLVIGAIVGFLIITLVCVGVCKYQQSLNRRHMFPCGHGSAI